MSPNNENIEKALRSFLATYHLEPMSEGPQSFYDEDFIKTFEVYSSEEDEKNTTICLIYFKKSFQDSYIEVN